MSEEHGHGWEAMLPAGRFELPAELERWRRMRDTEIPADAVVLMDRATQELTRARSTVHAVRVGEPAPAFTLPNALGREVSLDALLERGPVVLSFYRGSWCPFCNLELRALQQHLPRITELGASLVAVSAMTPDNSLSLAQRLELTYEVLTDAGLSVARSYGLVFELPDYLQETYERLGHPVPRFSGAQDQTLPIPATFVIDRAGITRFAFAEPNYMYRADPADILKVLEEPA